MDKPPPDGTAKLPPSTVLVSAAAMGLPIDDEATAARIAAGASAAVAAVRAAAGSVGDDPLLFEREPADYLALLEALADPAVPR